MGPAFDLHVCNMSFEDAVMNRPDSNFFLRQHSISYFQLNFSSCSIWLQSPCFLQLKKRVRVKCVPYFVRRYKNKNHLKIEVILEKRKRVNVSCEKKKSECQSGHLLNVSRPLCMKIQLCQDSILNLALSRLTCIGSLEIRHDVRKNT